MGKRAIVFRVDGSSMAGLAMGHIERCLSLGKTLKEKLKCDLLCVTNVYGDGAIINKIKTAEFIVHNVSNNEEAAILIKELNVPLLIVDLPYTEQEYFRNLYDGKKLTIIISDRPEHAQFSYKYCDIFLGPSPLLREIRQEKYYVGERFIILDKVFEKYNGKVKKIKKVAKDIVITQGGADPFNLMVKTIRALKPIRDKVRLTLLVGLAMKTEYFKGLKEELIENYAPDKYVIKVNVSRNEMARELFDADIGIISAGNVLYEALCVGTPVVAVCHHERQNQVARFFELRDTITNVGIGDEIPEKAILEATQKLMNDTEARRRMSLSGKKLIDGKGIDRAVDIIARSF